jgi:hypothetical protein
MWVSVIPGSSPILTKFCFSFWRRCWYDIMNYAIRGQFQHGGVTLLQRAPHAVSDLLHWFINRTAPEEFPEDGSNAYALRNKSSRFGRWNVKHVSTQARGRPESARNRKWKTKQQDLRNFHRPTILAMFLQSSISEWWLREAFRRFSIPSPLIVLSTVMPSKSIDLASIYHLTNYRFWRW